MARLVQFGQSTLLSDIEGEQLRVTAGVSWLARLSLAPAGNRLNVFYHRIYLTPMGGMFRLEPGIYEVEFDGGNGPHRIAFEVRGGALGWVSSVTLAKRATMNKISQALASDLR